MADLFQSEYDVGSLRRGVQDGETLWNILAEDGTVTIVPDPTGAEQESAVEELAKLNETRAQRERDGKSLDPEKEQEENNKIAALARTVNFQAPPSAQQPPAEDEAEAEAAPAEEKVGAK